MILKTAATLLILCLGASASAAVLYGVDSTNDDNSLYTINLSTGVASRIGGLGVGKIFVPDLASDGENLFVSGGNAGSNLYSVDKRTGAATLIGDYGIGQPIGLAYDTSTSTLFAASYKPDTTGSLYSIDRTTGRSTFIAPLAYGIKGLTYDSVADRLVGVTVYSTAASGRDGTFFAIDRGSGAQARLGYGGFLSGSDIAFDATDRSYYEVTVGQLYRRDPVTFARTLIIPDGSTGQITGLAFAAAASVPEPATWGLMIVGFGVVGAGLRERRTLASAT